MARLFVLLFVSFCFVLGAVNCEECGENEVREVTIGCHLTCDRPVLPEGFVCAHAPTEKCVCLKGYYRNAANKCVELHEC
ncbi:hypothetical protein RN001_007777 [Aquatica leii]|uniref:TIL domain-containing protein n=1 Tax=Aquatica leii TaxID=1421715 RepID=A0AAN7S994_9COLE|nr:hypothetical protein RN001_007777 [Aquatica leii]